MTSSLRHQHATRRAALARERRLRDDDKGISAVLGAILLFGLLVVTLVRIRVAFVPVWDHDREAAFMDEVTGQIAQIKTDFDRQVANQTSATVSDPVSLGGNGGFTFFQGSDKPGTLTFTPRAAGEGFKLESNQLTIQTRDGADLEGLQAYTAVTNGQTANNVAGLVTLRIRLDNPMSATNGATMRVDVTNGVNNCVAQMIIVIGAPPTPPRNVEVATYSGYPGACVAAPSFAPVHLSDTLIGCVAPCVSPTTFFIDALDPDLQFGSALAATDAPWTVKFVLTGATPVAASTIFAYDQNVAGGINRVGGGGLVQAGFSGLLSVGTLSFDKNNQRYPSQKFVDEYGAVIVDQEGTSAMAIPPIFRITTTATQAKLDIVLPALTGTPNQVGGSDKATLTSTPQGARGSLDALAPMVTFTLSTSYGATWAKYFDGIFTTAGFTANTHYIITSSPTNVVLTFYGPTSAPGDLATNDVVLELHTGPLALDLRATG